MRERFSGEVQTVVKAMAALLPANIQRKGDHELLQEEDITRLEEKYATLGIEDIGREYRMWKAKWRRNATSPFVDGK